MKFIILFILIVNLSASEKFEYTSRFGFLYSGTVLSNFKDARNALSKWLKETAAEHNGNVLVSFYPDSESLYKDFKQNKLDMVVLNLDFFFRNKNEIEMISDSYWTLLSNKVKHTQLYLISNKSSNINSFKDIKGKTITIKDEDLTSEVWLDKNSLLVNKKTYNKTLQDIKKVTKESTTILNVFFKKTDLAIVTKNTWDTMVELNPSVTKKVKVIEKSEKIHFPFIGVFSKNADKKGKKSFIELSKDVLSLDGGEQISELLKFDTLLWIENNELNKLEKYYQEYFDLKSKYK